jgi:class 3 adenylate cyclase
MRRPETKYAKLGDLYIAYQVHGEGPPDFLYLFGFSTHADVGWEYPPTERWNERFSSFSRVIFFDRRGAGASDPVPLDALPTWEDWTEDMTAVLDEVGSERVFLCVALDAGPMGMLFTATYPDRVAGLILVNTAARRLTAPDYTLGVTSDVLDGYVSVLEKAWGTEEFAALTNPGVANDPTSRAWLAKFQRAAATPRTAAAQLRYAYGLDARAVLPLIRVPTLVLHMKDCPFVPIEHGRYLAEHISGARFVELPGSDVVPFTHPEALELTMDLVEEFMTGQRRTAESNRVLATVLFTDIVGSTERAAHLGDMRWKEILDRVDRIAEGEVAKFGGRLINTTGDGHLATFDGPGKAIRCARALVGAVKSQGIELRAGLHTGEIELRGNDVGGIAVHIGARVSALAGPSEVLVSRTVADLVAGSGILLEDRGEQALKGVPGEWRLFAVAET